MKKLLAVFAAIICTAHMGKASTPNVVMIMADDLSSEYLSAYHGKGVPTPNLERMAAEGIKFVNYVSPSICGPARAALVTSRSAKVTNVYHNKMYSPRISQDVNRFFTMGNMFKTQGYATCFTGKWNIPGPMLHYDTALVWDFDATTGCAMEDSYTSSRYWFPALEDENSVRVPTDASSFGPDLFAAHGMAFLQDKLQADEPFFWHYAMVEPHKVRGNDIPNAPGYSGSTSAARYRNMISYMDSKVGEVLDMVIGTNTIVVFVADNPTATEGKSWATPSGMFVPCIVWGSGIAQRGHTEALFTVHDIMPTLAKAIGAPTFTTDGRDHYDYWTGASHVTAQRKMSYIGASQVLVAGRDFFVRDAVRGNPEGIMRPKGKKAELRRYGRLLNDWCGPMLQEGRGALRGDKRFTSYWINIEKREQW